MKYLLVYTEEKITSGDQFMGGGEHYTETHKELFSTLEQAQNRKKLVGGTIYFFGRSKIIKIMNKIKQLEKALKKEKKKELYVNIMSTGTFFTEQDKIKVKDKNLKNILKKVKTITQRHNAKPFGFRFEDGNGENASGIYYITGKVLKYDDIPDDLPGFLKSNMRCNNWPICIENTNSYKFTCQFEPKDKIIDWDGNILINGDDKDLMEYRKNMKIKFDEYYKKL